MKRIASLLIVSFILSLNYSCSVHIKHDNGNHKGWYKNDKNPHHPNSDNPGHNKQKKKEKKKNN